jgi:hypothetical protein
MFTGVDGWEEKGDVWGQARGVRGVVKNGAVDPEHGTERIEV